MIKSTAMEFWGVRGTMPVSGRGFRKYGGHTLCASLQRPDAGPLIIDAGTGIKKLGDRLMESNRGNKLEITLLMTHFHLDHIMGLPFFSPLYSPDVSLTVLAPARPTETRRFLSSLMSGRLFPVTFVETPCRKKILELERGVFRVGPYEVSTCPLQHPQGSVALRIRDEGLDVVFSTDTEHPKKGVDKALARFIEGTDRLIYDATFTTDDYENLKRGWGHSTWKAGTELAHTAGAGELFLSHFSPDYKDDVLDDMVNSAKSEFARTSAAEEAD